MFEQDLIVKEIRQLGEAIARLMGLARMDQPQEVLEGIEGAKGALPLVPGMLDHAGAGALLQMLGRDQYLQLVQLLELEADALVKLKRPGVAALRRKRAQKLSDYLDALK